MKYINLICPLRESSINNKLFKKKYKYNLYICQQWSWPDNRQIKFIIKEEGMEYILTGGLV